MPRPPLAVLTTARFLRLVPLGLPLALAACMHSGRLPSGPSPEYEETPLPNSASAALPTDAGPPPAPPPPPPASPPPAR